MQLPFQVRHGTHITSHPRIHTWYSQAPAADSLTVLPVSIAAGILEYHLYDIGRFISRTLSHTLVTGLPIGADSASDHTLNCGNVRWTVKCLRLRRRELYGFYSLNLSRLIGSRTCPPTRPTSFVNAAIESRASAWPSCERFPVSPT